MKGLKGMGIYYTHQREEAWQQALRKGYLEASGEYAFVQ